MAISCSGTRVRDRALRCLNFPAKFGRGMGCSKGGLLREPCLAGTGCSADPSPGRPSRLSPQRHAPLPRAAGRCRAERWPPAPPGWGCSLAFASCPAKAAESEAAGGGEELLCRAGPGAQTSLLPAQEGGRRQSRVTRWLWVRVKRLYSTKTPKPSSSSWCKPLQKIWVFGEKYQSLFNSALPY